MKKLKGIKYIWWDLDDTLYPTNQKYLDRKMEELVKEYAKLKKISLEEAKKEYPLVLKKYGSSSRMFPSVFNKPANYGQKIQNKVDRRKYLEKDPKINEYFRGFKKKFPEIKHSIISNSDKGQIGLTLKIIGLDKKWFEHIISSTDLGYPKPDPRGYKKMITLTKLKPSQILYVGDREKADVLPAKRLGMKACLVTNKRSPTKADFKVKNLYGVSAHVY